MGTKTLPSEEALFSLNEDVKLAQSPKWRHLTNDLLEKGKTEKAALVARMCENQEKFMRNMTEDVRTYNVGTFEKFVFPMIRSTYANLISTDLFSVQPMSGPSALIFFMDVLYGSTKGSLTKGTVAQSSTRGQVNTNIGTNGAYSGEQINGENVGTGDTTEDTFTDTLEWTPVRPGTLKITAGAVVAADNGIGGLTGTGVTSGTVNYETGEVEVVFAAAPAAIPITASYRYLMEGNSKRPIIDLILTSDIVRAETHSLETNWSIEAEQDFMAVHGLEAAALMMSKTAEQLRFEIDRDNIAVLEQAINLAGTSTVQWDKTPPIGTDYYRHQMTVVNSLVETGNEIFKATNGRGEGEWIVCGVDVATVFEALPVFQPAPISGKRSGVRYIGNIQRWKIYKDPWMPATKAIMGHRGADWLEAGLAFCPYVPLWRTPLVTLTDQVRRVGMMSRFGRKLINPDWFVPFEVVAS